MRATKAHLSAQNKPQTQTLHEAFACSTPDSWNSNYYLLTTADTDPIYTVKKHGVHELLLKHNMYDYLDIK